MYFPSRTLTIAFMVECTMMHTVLRATPNKWPVVRYSEGVAKNHQVIATLFSTLIAFRIMVSLRCKTERSWLQRYRKVSVFILKFWIQ